MLQSAGEQHCLERLSGRVLEVQQQERLTHKPHPLHIRLLYTIKLIAGNLERFLTVK